MVRSKTSTVHEYLASLTPEQRRVALAAQKNYYALYLLGAYADPKQAQYLRREFTKRGKKLDMGKSCLRFRKLEDLPLDVIGNVIASTPPDELVTRVKAARRT